VKLSHLCGAVAVFCIALFAVVPNLSAQEATPAGTSDIRKIGPSARSYSAAMGSPAPGLMERNRAFESGEAALAAPELGRFPRCQPLRLRDKKASTAIGTLFSKATFAKNMFPPSMSLTGAPPIAPTTMSSSAECRRHAWNARRRCNLVAFNNLYVNSAGTGYCAGLTAPPFCLPINHHGQRGRILTSPVLSLDGTQIIFVESVSGNPGSSIFHALTWTAGQGGLTLPPRPRP